MSGWPNRSDGTLCLKRSPKLLSSQAGSSLQAIPMHLSDLIQPTTAAGTALFLQWDGYHVFSIPCRELQRSPSQVRLFGVGGKRQSGAESFADCALREGQEEIGNVLVGLRSAQKTLFLNAAGAFECIELADEPIRPRLIWEKRNHSAHGSMADSQQAYYLVAFNAELRAKPQPCSEIAALVYLTDAHLAQMQTAQTLCIYDWLNLGVQIDYQRGISIPGTTVLIPHGTVYLLMLECNG